MYSTTCLFFTIFEFWIFQNKPLTTVVESKKLILDSEFGTGQNMTD